MVNYRIWAKISAFILGWMLLEQIYFGWIAKYGWGSFTRIWAWVYVLMYIVAYSVILVPLIHFGRKPKLHE